MINIPQSVRILIGSTPIDMRKSIDGLTAIVQEELGEDASVGSPKAGRPGGNAENEARCPSLAADNNLIRSNTLFHWWPIDFGT